MAGEIVSNEELIAYACGEIEGEDAQRVEAYMARNVQAAATVAHFRAVGQHVRAAEFVDPPTAAISRAKQLFRSASAGLAVACREWVDAVFAHLIYDSRLQPIAIRSANVGDAIMMTYKAKEVDIDLRAVRKSLSEEKSPWELMGQITSNIEYSPGLEVLAIECGTEKTAAKAPVDGSSMFSMELAPGQYNLYIVLPEGVIILTEVRLD